jgi:hypothetical protein
LNLIKIVSLVTCLCLGGCGFISKKSTSNNFNSQHAGSCGPSALFEALTDLGIETNTVEISKIILYREYLPGAAGRFFISQEITSIQEIIRAADFYDVQMVETDMDWRELRDRGFVVIVLGVIKGTAAWHYMCVPSHGDINEYLDVKRTWWLRRKCLHNKNLAF